MLAVILQTIKKMRGSILGFTAAAALLMWMLISVYPSFSAQQEQLVKVFENYPQELVKAFGIGAQTFLASLEGFLSGETYSLMWPLILIIMVVSYGSAALAGEIDRGTIGILLSQPISRVKLFLGKYLAGAVGITAFIFASVFSAIPFALLYGVEYRLQNYLTLAILGTLFALALFSITMVFSSASSERGRVTLFSAGLFIAMYFLKILAALQESLAGLKYLSLFHYFDYTQALLNNRIELISIAVFLGVILLGTLGGIYWFNRRDIAAS